MPLNQFDISQILNKKYEIIQSEDVSIRPGFAFMVEFLTGRPPSKTNMWLDFIKHESPFSFLKGIKWLYFPNRSRVHKKLLSQLAKRLKGHSYNPHNIPSCLLPYFNMDQKLTDFLEKTADYFKLKYRVKSFDKASGTVENVEKKITNTKAELFFGNYSLLDFLGHQKGPNSKEYSELVKKIFQSIYRIQDAEIFEEIEIMSDHGMYEIKKYIDYRPIIKGLKIPEDFVFFANSPLLRFWSTEGNLNTIEHRLEKLQELGIGTILTEETKKAWKFPLDRKFGDLIFWANRGYHFVPDFFHGRVKIKGMHGYLENDITKKTILSKI